MYTLGYTSQLHIQIPKALLPLSLWRPAFPLMPTVSRLALPRGISLLSCFFLRDLQAALCESVAHTSRHGLLGQASPALLFHTITLESRGTPRGAHCFPKILCACQISVLEELPLRAEDIKEPDRNQRLLLSFSWCAGICHEVLCSKQKPNMGLPNPPGQVIFAEENSHKPHAGSQTRC